MVQNSRSSLVVYFSPAGSTRRVADVMAETLTQLGHRVDVLDLGGKDGLQPEQLLSNAARYDCLWIGSPIYVNHAVPLVVEFIRKLPEGRERFAVPFVTYGEVTSGDGLFEMGSLLSEKGYSLLGAAKVPALHSLLWLSENPLGEGRPDKKDLATVEDLVKAVNERMSVRSGVNRLTPEDLVYQSRQDRELFTDRTLEMMKAFLPPMRLDESLCSSCGVCEEQCPTQNITLNPHPQFGNRCVACFNCVRLCDPGALTNDFLTVAESMIRDRKAQFDEKAQTRIFL